MPYFNYSVHSFPAAEASHWERREFLHAWWSLYDDDSRWTPPEYGRLRRELDPKRNDHLARLDAMLLYIDALYRTGVRRSRTDQQEIPLTSVLERPLAAAVAVIDPRRRGQTAHLAIPHFAFDREAFDDLYRYLVESLPAQGFHRVLAPVGLSPHLGSGLLVDGWDEWPPLHTPSNPPYLPELIESRWQPFQSGRLYRAPVPPQPTTIRQGSAAILPFDPARLAADLLPLLVAAVENPTAGFPPPDAVEAAFLLRILRPETLTGYVAEIDGVPVGFVLIGPDTTKRVRAVRGGRALWGRGLLALETRLFPLKRVSMGRIYFGAVLQAWRGQGVGDQLWRHALRAAHAQGWSGLTVGPLWLPRTEVSPSLTFLDHRADASRQAYRLYEWSF